MEIVFIAGADLFHQRGSMNSTAVALSASSPVAPKAHKVPSPDPHHRRPAGAVEVHVRKILKTARALGPHHFPPRSRHRIVHKNLPHCYRAKGKSALEASNKKSRKGADTGTKWNIGPRAASFLDVHDKAKIDLQNRSARTSSALAAEGRRGLPQPRLFGAAQSPFSMSSRNGGPISRHSRLSYLVVVAKAAGGTKIEGGLHLGMFKNFGFVTNAPKGSMRSSILEIPAW